MKKTMLILFGILLVALMSMGAYGAAVTAVTVTAPSAGATVKGTSVILNGTYTDTTDAGGLINVTVWAGAGSGAPTNLTCYNSSVTLGQGRWNCNMNFNSHNDNASLVLNITVGNQSDIGASTTITLVNDDTNPTAAFKTGQELNGKKGSTFYYDCGSSSDNIVSTTNLIYQVNMVKPGGTNASTVRTTRTGSFSGTDIDQTGIYTLSCSVQDTTPDAVSNPTGGNSARVTQSITISSGSGAFVQEQAAQQEQKEKSSKGVIVVLLGGILLFWILSKGGK